MTSFPLYDNLIREAEDSELTVKQKDRFMKLIKDIDDTGSELVYALIRLYQLENCEDKSTFKLPYSGKFVKHDIQFNLEKLPLKLQQMLYEFIQIHTKTMKEESKITEERIKI